jgi:hypothetical protein
MQLLEPRHFISHRLSLSHSLSLPPSFPPSLPPSHPPTLIPVLSPSPSLSLPLSLPLPGPPGRSSSGHVPDVALQAPLSPSLPPSLSHSRSPLPSFPPSLALSFSLSRHGRRLRRTLPAGLGPHNSTGPVFEFKFEHERTATDPEAPVARGLTRTPWRRRTTPLVPTRSVSCTERLRRTRQRRRQPGPVGPGPEI